MEPRPTREAAAPKPSPQPPRLPAEPPPGFEIPEKIGSTPGDREHRRRLKLAARKRK